MKIVRYTEAEIAIIKREWPTATRETLAALLPGRTYSNIKQMGGHVWANVVPACRSCNSQKNRKTPQEWFETLRQFEADRAGASC